MIMGLVQRDNLFLPLPGTYLQGAFQKIDIIHDDNFAT
jgi:hypothetical protein